MAPISVDRIISVSSEEQTHKAENILNISDVHLTWRCKAGEKQATVILQLLKPSVISSIDVGNDNSAFIEIFVGKTTSDEFEVLLVTSSLMTLHECKNGLNINKVRFFGPEQLSPACKESWDRVKIVCTQPYIKQAKFGLSFVTFHSKDVPQMEVQPSKDVHQSQTIQLGSFTLKNEDDDSDSFASAGRLFAKRHMDKDVVRMPESPLNRLLAVHKHNLETIKHKNTNSSKQNNKNSPLSNQKTPKPPKDSIKPKIKDESSVQKKHLITSPIIENDVAKKKEFPSPSSSQQLEPSKKKIKLIKNPLPITKPFSELLRGVVFAMSGYENPYRSNLRSKALEMGATYKSNLDQSCTHLICAFMNTPKYNEAKRLGAYRIIQKDWIEKCYSNRCRYPWRRFALDKSEQNKPESEDEIYERIELNQCDDTDDEWTNVPESKAPTPSTSQTILLEDQQNNIYNADTDVDSDLEAVPNDILADQNSEPLPLLDNVFQDCLFYLSTKLKSSLRKECYRYIIALDGKLTTKDKCNYIVSTEKRATKDKKIVTPQWILDCYDAGQVLSL